MKLKDYSPAPAVMAAGIASSLSQTEAAATKLSRFVTGRYMPDEAWKTIWQTILNRLQPQDAPVALKWTPTVRPSLGRDEPLPPDEGVPWSGQIGLPCGGNRETFRDVRIWQSK